MCGISGLQIIDKDVSKSQLRKNNGIMKHRGPDGEGTWISSDRRTGFSHVRLSIGDLDSRSNQPFRYKNYTITFNGEIYN